MASKNGKNPIIAATVVILLAVLLAGYYLTDAQFQKQNIKEVTIGWIGPLTGPVAFLGVDNLNAVRMAAEEHNIDGNIKINIIAEDDAYNGDKALSIYKGMVAGGKAGIIIMSTYDGTLFASNKALKDGVIIVNPIDNDLNLAELNENIFAIAKQTESIASVISEGMIKQNKKKAFVIFNDDDLFMSTVEAQIKKSFKKSGGLLVSSSYSQETTDFTSLLLAGRLIGADAYVFLGYEETMMAMQKARALGIEEQFYAVNSLGGMEEIQFAHFTYLDGNTNEAAAFLELYKTKYNKSPVAEWTAMQAYDAMRIIMNAIDSAASKSGNFVDNVRTELLKTRDFKGVSGDINIESNGASSGIYWHLYMLKDGKEIKIN